MAERLDLDRQAEAGRVDIAKQFVGERDILFERRLDFLDSRVAPHQIQNADDLRVARRQAMRLGSAIEKNQPVAPA